MSVSLKTLLQVAPFPEEERNELLSRYDELNDDDKFELSNAAWRALSIQYYSKLKYEHELLVLQIQEGKRKFNPNDFEEAKAKLLHEFAHKLEAAESEESITEVRKQLEQFKTKPLVQDQKK